MSNSKFHSLNLFKLTHAWLNLRDKHMTTSGINQIAHRRGHLRCFSSTSGWAVGKLGIIHS